MDLNLNNKIILVTGGAKGIGEGITRVLAQEGAFPVILGRNEADNKFILWDLKIDIFKIMLSCSFYSYFVIQTNGH